MCRWLGAVIQKIAFLMHEKRVVYHKKKLLKNLGLADRQSQNGNLMKHSQIYSNLKDYPIYIT